MKPEQNRIKTVLIDTVSLLCKSSLSYRHELKIEAVIGVTVDENDVFIVHINESFSPEGGVSGTTSAAAEMSVAVAPLSAHEEQEFQAPRMPYARKTSSGVKRMRTETDSMVMWPSSCQAMQHAEHASSAKPTASSIPGPRQHGAVPFVSAVKQSSASARDVVTGVKRSFLGHEMMDRSGDSYTSAVPGSFADINPSMEFGFQSGFNPSNFAGNDFAVSSAQNDMLDGNTQSDLTSSDPEQYFVNAVRRDMVPDSGVVTGVRRSFEARGMLGHSELDASWVPHGLGVSHTSVVRPRTRAHGLGRQSSFAAVTCHSYTIPSKAAAAADSCLRSFKFSRYPHISTKSASSAAAGDSHHNTVIAGLLAFSPSKRERFVNTVPAGFGADVVFPSDSNRNIEPDSFAGFSSSREFGFQSGFTLSHSAAVSGFAASHAQNDVTSSQPAAKRMTSPLSKAAAMHTHTTWVCTLTVTAAMLYLLVFYCVELRNITEIRPRH